MPQPDTRTIMMLALFSALIVAAVFHVQGNVGFNIGDEGYLWYGAQRVILGEIPIRDFMAYDPGRYYWSAGIMRVMGSNGIVALRIAIAVFQCVGLFVVLLMLARTWKYSNYTKAFLLLVAAGVFLLWMLPRHKLFDITVSIALVGVLAHLIERPSIRRYFLTGVTVGVAAIFGRNHGLYGVAGGLGAIAYAASLQGGGVTFLSALRWWILGIFTGYLPMLAALALIPGFARAFWEGILFLFEYKSTNITLPVPWPWQVPFGKLPSLYAAHGALLGSFFVAVLVFGIAGLVFVIRGRIKGQVLNPLFAASAFMALPYAHYAFSRADINHLAQGIFPFLIGMLALPAAKPEKTVVSVAFLMLVTSAFVTLPSHPGWRSTWNGGWRSAQVGQDTLQVSPGTERVLALLTSLVEKYAGDGRVFVVAPFSPGAYALFERKSPMWEIYALFPRSASFQKAEIKRIRDANPGFVVVLDRRLDGREELRFSNTHPIINQYFRNNYEPVMQQFKAQALYIYKSKQAG